jgi:hypothetical protein
MKINFEVIPHEDHRYSTVGDYWKDHNGVDQFRVSDMGNNDYEFLVFIHELIESYLTGKRGIKEPGIMAFDVEFEKKREKGLVEGEPGDAIDAPYRKEHRFAENIERQVAFELGVDWFQYDKIVELL